MREEAPKDSDPRQSVKELPVPARIVESRIVILRGLRVMLGSDLAELYGVSVRRLNEQVKRNRDRFPEDFVFQVTVEENRILKSQIATSSWGGARRSLPFAFTEQGVAMLSSVLHSPRAVLVNVEIMRAFVRLRRILADNADLAHRLDELERKYDVQFKVVFDAIRQLMEKPKAKPIGKIGFHVREKMAKYTAGGSTNDEVRSANTRRQSGGR
jgi:hypothetical protein